MNIKKILGIVGLVVIIVVLIFFISKYKSGISDVSTTTPKTNISDSSYDGLSQIEPDFLGQDLPLSNSPKNVAWETFQKYLKYNKEQNLEGVKSIVYKVAPICEDVKNTIECKARMSLAYQYGSVLKKENFVNIWSDEKQIILATDFKIEEDDSILGRHRAIIFFVKDNESLKLLSFSPFKGATISKGVASREEIDDRLIIYTEDKDEDGIVDYDEECLSPKEGEVCVKTSPKIRDTDGDGFWDGINVLIAEKMPISAVYQ